MLEQGGNSDIGKFAGDTFDYESKGTLLSKEYRNWSGAAKPQLVEGVGAVSQAASYRR